VNTRISPAVEDGQDDYERVLDQKVNEVWKSTQHRAMNVTVDSRVDPWVVGESSEEIGDRAAELGTKTRLLLVVPVFRLFEVAFR
jgi:hypothetical protein